MRNVVYYKKHNIMVYSQNPEKAQQVTAKNIAMTCLNGFTQCHACVVQTTTRYAGVHKKLYKKITNRITIRMFKSIVKKKGDFNGK